MSKLSMERAIEVLYTVRAYYASLTAGYPKGKDCKGIGDVMCSEIANSCLMAIKALEQQPNRCDSCINSEEQDGSNCYECVKGLSDNFEARPTDADCISREAVMKCFKKWQPYMATRLWDYEQELKDLPSVTPKADTEWGSIGNNTDLETVPTNLQDWLSTDYFEGYKQGVDDVLEKIKEAQNSFEIYGNKKTFKGLSRRDIVFECWKIIQNAIKDYKNEY